MYDMYGYDSYGYDDYGYGYDDYSGYDYFGADMGYGMPAARPMGFGGRGRAMAAAVRDSIMLTFYRSIYIFWTFFREIMC